MTRIHRIRRCLHLPRNDAGRDLVVGDLHGHRSLLERELDKLRFDPASDRLFSVGDLINRGPESLATLALIEEPWFHAVLGNHELMLLNFLQCYESRLHSRKTFPVGAGEWINEAMAARAPEVERLVEAMAALPIAMHVDGELPFNVAHADFHQAGSVAEDGPGDGTISVHKADALTSSRQHLGEALRENLQDLEFAEHSVQISPTPFGTLPMTYVGHSPSRHVTVHNSYVHIDQGVCAGSSKRADTPPTVLDHRTFAFWLGGVATACV